MTQNTTIINQVDNDREIINRKIDLATAGLHHFISEHFTIALAVKPIINTSMNDT